MKSKKGSLLIASPGLLDPNFCRSVVFIAEHNEEGAFGLVLNSRADAKVADLWSAISSEPTTSKAHAFVGGPVQKNAVLVLHGYADLGADTEPVVPGVFLGSEVELLGELLRRESVAETESPGQPARFRVFCGYSGWGKGQLDGELKAGGWLTYPASADLVFHEEPDQLWSLVLKELGGVYRFFALMPRDPENN